MCNIKYALEYIFFSKAEAKRSNDMANTYRI